MQKDETRPTEELGDPKALVEEGEVGDPKALVEEGEVCSNVEELRSKEPTSYNELEGNLEPTSYNALEGNLEGSKTPQFRLDGCVDGLVCETMHDKDGPVIQVRKDDGFTSSQARVTLSSREGVRRHGGQSRSPHEGNEE